MLGDDGLGVESSGEGSSDDGRERPVTLLPNSILLNKRQSRYNNFFQSQNACIFYCLQCGN